MQILYNASIENTITIDIFDMCDHLHHNEGMCTILPPMACISNKLQTKIQTEMK